MIVQSRNERPIVRSNPRVTGYQIVEILPEFFFAIPGQNPSSSFFSSIIEKNCTNNEESDNVTGRENL